MNSLEKIQTHVTRNHGNTETFKQLLVLMETEISAVMSKRRRERVNSMGELIDVLVRANRIDVIRNIVDCLGDDHELKRLLSQLDQELKRKDVTGNNEYRKQQDNSQPKVQLEIIEEDHKTVFNTQDFHQLSNIQKVARLNFSAQMRILNN